MGTDMVGAKRLITATSSGPDDVTMGEPERDEFSATKEKRVWMDFMA